MSIQLLNDAMSCARDKAMSLTISVKESAPSANPLDLMSGGQNIMSMRQHQGNTFAEEAYRHYRGRFAAASKVLVQRIVGQAVMVGEITQKANKNSIRSRWKKSGIKISLPSFLKGVDSSRLSILDSHELIDAINNPNEIMVRATLWSQTLQNLLITGRAFWMLSDVNGRKQIFPLPTTWVKPDHSRGLFSAWKVGLPGSTTEPIPVAAEFMAHFYFPDPENPLRAQSPLEQQSGGVLIDEAIQTAQRMGFKNGIHPTVALVAGDATTGDGDRPLQLTSTQRNQFITWMRQQYADVQRFGTPIILDAMIRDVKILSTKPIEMAFLESSSVAEALVYMGLGVNPIAAGKVEDVNRASSALADTHLVNNAVNPIIEMMSQTINKWVVPFFDKSNRIRAWIDPAEPHDPVLQLERNEIGLKYQCITRNEFRRDILNLPPIPGLDSFPTPVTTQMFPAEQEKPFRITDQKRLGDFNGNGRH